MGDGQDALDATPLDCLLLADRYTLLEQGALPLLDRCDATGVGVIVDPFNSGLLAGQAKCNYGTVPPGVMARTDVLRAAGLGAPPAAGGAVGRAARPWALASRGAALPAGGVKDG